MKKEIRWLKASFTVGAVADGIVAVSSLSY